MKNSIELYINNRKVDLSNSTKVLFTYKQKDVYSPVAVKNSFSKTITLEGTANNNDIFNNLYSLDVSYTNGGVQNFNSSKRNPFELYQNGELVESGYMKLDSIKHTGNTVKYNITLYGGLGDFLYNLMYDADGNKRTLASLDYDTDLSFNINKESVELAWKVLNPTYTWARSTDREMLKKWQCINFMPAYNGISETLNAENVLVNTNGYTGHMRKWDGNTNKWVNIQGFPVQFEDNTYTTKNGYGLVELPKPMNEWQMRDLRSYMQRPVISFKKIIDAIKNPENNGGYNVVLDTDFFNSKNPYYENAWLTLPLLNDLKNKENQTEIIIPNTIPSTPVYSSLGQYWEYKLNTSQVIPSASNQCKFKTSLALKQSGSTLTDETLYFSANINNTDTSTEDYNNKGKQFQGICLKLYAYDSSSNPQRVAGSNIIYLTSKLDNGEYLNSNDAGLYNEDGLIETKIGYFTRSGSTQYWVWPEEIEFTIDVSNVNVDHFRIAVWYQHKTAGKRYTKFEPLYLFNSRNFTCNNTTINNYRGNFYFRNDLEQQLYDRELKVLSGGEDLGLFSNSPVSQNVLLATEYTPADYLLSYTKLFNLFYDKDPFSKTVYIRTMKNYYDGKRIDLQKHIDRSKDINITPLAFDKNVYEMEYKTGKTSDIAEKYLERYGSDFGSQKIYTGYDFDSDKKELYDGVFQNAVQTLQNSKFFTMSQSDTDNETPTFLYNTVTYKLFNSEGETSEVKLIRPSNVSETSINPKSRTFESPLVAPYYDAFDKVLFSNEEKPIDGKDCLVFFNGFKEIYTDVYQPYYILSDDVQTMINIDEKPCYLYSQSEYDVAGNKICIRLTNLPQFSRYITVDSGNYIINSWDLGETKEIYLPDYKFAAYNTCIYNRYWNNYVKDLYDIDTKIVECYVKFDEKVMQSNLKHYYYFDNSYWVITEIMDYNPDANETVKVKFVKVNDFGVYSNYDPAEIPEVMSLTLVPTVVGSGTSLVDAYIWIEDGGAWFIESNSRISFSQTSGVGDTHLTFYVPANTGRTATERTFTITVTKSDYSYQTSAKVTQLCSKSNVVFTVEQFGNNLHNDVPQTGGTCYYTVRSTYPWTVESDRTYAVPQSSGGTGNTETGETLEVDWSVSDTYGTRNAWLTFNSAGEEIRMYKAQAGITTDQYLQYVYQQSGGSFTTSAYTSGGTVETKPYWVSVIDNGNGTYTITAEENEGSERNGTVIISAPTNEGSFKINIQVTQTENVVPVNTFSVAPMYLGFEYSGGTGTIEITNPDNHTWSIVSYPEWVTVTSGSLLVTVVASANDTIYTKSDYLIIYDSTFDETFSILLTSQYNPNASSFKVEPQTLDYLYDGGYKYLNIINPENHTWRIVSADTWYGFNQSQGSIATTISCYAEENSGNTRTSTAVIYDITENSVRNIYITQYASGATPSLTINPNPLTIASSGGTVQVAINYSNRAGDFLIATPSSSAITVGAINFTGDTALVNITFPENTDFTGKTYSITFTGLYLSETLNVTQDGRNANLDVVPTSITYESSGGTTTITITTNDSFTIN